MIRVAAPPAPRGGPAPRPMEVLPGQAVPRLDLVEPRGKPLGASCNRAIRLLAFRHSVFRLGGPPPAHCRAFAHFFSEISRLRFERDLGRGIARASTRSEYLSHSTPRCWWCRYPNQPASTSSRHARSGRPSRRSCGRRLRRRAGGGGTGGIFGTSWWTRGAAGRCWTS